MSKNRLILNKSDMTYITDDDLSAIKIALDRYYIDMTQGKLDYREDILNLQKNAVDRMNEFFVNQHGILAIPYFPMIETF